MARIAYFRPGSALRVAALAAAMLALPGAALAESGIKIIMNQAKILKLERPADTIVIGNSEIADASVQDSETVVITGRGFGVTNLVVLDNDGNPVIDEQVTVSRQAADSVRVYRRSEVQTLSCTPFCESSHKNEAERTSEMEMSVGQ